MNNLKSILPVSELIIPEIPPRDDPAWNLALEEVLLNDARLNYFMLWINRPSVIVGRNQCIENEVDTVFAQEHGIPIFRRITGGGAVYHDKGNLNFSWILPFNDCANAGQFYCPITAALKKIGIHASFNGRNDLIAGNRKLSGSAMFIRNGRMLFHGTLLIQSNLDFLERILTPSCGKLYKNGIRSVRERVVNAADISMERLTLDKMRNLILSAVADDAAAVVSRNLSDRTLKQVEYLRAAKYMNRNWNIRGDNCADL